MIPDILKKKYEAGICVMCDRKVDFAGFDAYDSEQYKLDGLCKMCKSLELDEPVHQGTKSIDVYQCMYKVFHALTLTVDDLSMMCRHIDISSADTDEIVSGYGSWLQKEGS